MIERLKKYLLNYNIDAAAKNMAEKVATRATVTKAEWYQLKRMTDYQRKGYW